jgi:hypothetical protein
MKISKFVWSVLVAFVAVGLVAPQQAEGFTSEADMDGTWRATETTFTPTSPFMASLGGATGIFAPLNDVPATFKSITWTGSGDDAVLVGGPISGLWTAQPVPFLINLILQV